MSAIVENITKIWAQLSTQQKIRLAIAVVATVGVVWSVSLYATRIRYGVLFASMTAEDAAPVLAYLKENQVSYRLGAGGSIIEVPVEKVSELRMELAGEGLPRGGGVGFEIFDKPSFGLSDFVQSVNYQRALERELSRTIQSLDSVESARVHLALPEESIFADERRAPSASVVVRLRGGVAPASNRVRAIAHLVASGVEGLEPSRVSVLDSHGRMLSGGESAGGIETLPASQLEAEREMESRIESTLLSILEPVVGAGKVRARATVELKTAMVQRVEEKYDPNGTVVRSEQKQKTRRTGSGGTAGVPGVASNLPGGGGTAVGGADETQSAVTNFEINKTVSTIAEPSGTLLRQSVAVVVDNAAPTTEGAAGGETTSTVARSEEEMRKITEIVRAAVGIDEERGDVLIVENVPFDETANPEVGAPAGGGDWLHFAVQIARYAALPVAVLLIALLVIRPAIAVLRSLRQQGAATATAPTVAELQASLAQGTLTPGEGPGLRRKLIEAASQDPETAAVVVRNWLKPGGEE